MKLILTHEVDGLGSPGDIVDVKDGYGRNFLLPRKLAVRWSRGAQAEVDSLRRERAAREHATLDDAVAARDQLQALGVTLTKRAGSSGRLFGAVTSSDIAEAIKAAGGPAVDRRTIALPRTIKSLGAHMVTVRLHSEVTASIEVEVVDPDSDYVPEVPESTEETTFTRRDPASAVDLDGTEAGDGSDVAADDVSGDDVSGSVSPVGVDEPVEPGAPVRSS